MSLDDAKAGGHIHFAGKPGASQAHYVQVDPIGGFCSIFCEHPSIPELVIVHLNKEVTIQVNKCFSKLTDLFSFSLKKLCHEAGSMLRAL